MSRSPWLSPRKIALIAALTITALLGVVIPLAVADSGPSWVAPYSYASAITATGSPPSNLTDAPAVAVNASGNGEAVWLNDASDTQTSDSAELQSSQVVDGTVTGPVQMVGSADSGPASGDIDDLLLASSDTPAVATNSKGESMAVWVDDGSLVSAYYAAGSPSPQVNDLAPQDGDLDCDANPQVAMDSAGDAIAVWSDCEDESDNPSIWYAIAPAGTGVFGTPTEIASVGAAEVGNTIAADAHVAMNAAGDAAIVWTQTFENGDPAIEYAIGDATAGFGDLNDPTDSGLVATSNQLADTQSNPSVAIDAAGYVTVAWANTFESGGDGGNGSLDGTTAIEEADLPDEAFQFNDPNVLEAAAEGEDYDNESDPVIAMDAAGATAVAFNDTNAGEVVALSRYANSLPKRGAAPLSPAKAPLISSWPSKDEETDLGGVTQTQPQLAIDSSDNITVLYQSADNAVDAATALAGSFKPSPAPVSLQDGASTAGPGGQAGTTDVPCDDELPCDALSVGNNGAAVALWLQTDRSNITQVADESSAAATTPKITHPGGATWNSNAKSTSLTGTATVPTIVCSANKAGVYAGQRAGIEEFGEDTPDSESAIIFPGAFAGVYTYCDGKTAEYAAEFAVPSALGDTTKIEPAGLTVSPGDPLELSISTTANQVTYSMTDVNTAKTVTASGAGLGTSAGWSEGVQRIDSSGAGKVLLSGSESTSQPNAELKGPVPSTPVVFTDLSVNGKPLGSIAGRYRDAWKGSGGKGEATASDIASKTAFTVNFASSPQPTFQKTTNIVPFPKGTVYVKLPGTHHFVKLKSLTKLPFGTVINANHGSVQITTKQPDGKDQTGVFYDGEFTVKQTKSGKTILTLVGGSYKGCPAPPHRHRKTKKKHHHALGAATAAKAQAGAVEARHKHKHKHKKKKKGSKVNGLWSNAHGDFTTKGNNGSGAVLGTKWLTRDQCDGTYFRVTRDKVEVTAYYPHRHHKLVHDGHHYLAPARGWAK